MSDHTRTVREQLRIHLRESLIQTDSPRVEAELRAELDLWDDPPAAPLVECPVCGRVGFPERIQEHECKG